MKTPVAVRFSITFSDLDDAVSEISLAVKEIALKHEGLSDELKIKSKLESDKVHIQNNIVSYFELLGMKICKDKNLIQFDLENEKHIELMRYCVVWDNNYIDSNDLEDDLNPFDKCSEITQIGLGFKIWLSLSYDCENYDLAKIKLESRCNKSNVH